MIRIFEVRDTIKKLEGQHDMIRRVQKEELERWGNEKLERVRGKCLGAE